MTTLYSATGGQQGQAVRNYDHNGGSSGLPTSTSNTVANSGGGGQDAEDCASGGSGGGAGGAGSNGVPCTIRPGGSGRLVFGTTYGKGGDGGLSRASPTTNGPANSGQGGSGGNGAGGNAGRGTGGSGVVVIRYLTI